MSTLVDEIFVSSIALIKERLRASGSDQQLTILTQLDAIAKTLPALEVRRSQTEVLADLKEAIEHGGDRARVFFTHSFASWYRSASTKKTAQLHHWAYLDMSNRWLFLEMLTLRDLGRFDDEALYQFEQYCLSVIGK